MSRMKPVEAPPKLYYSLEAAAVLIGCTAIDLVHYGVQNKATLLVGVPDEASIRVYNENNHELSELFILKPQLLCLSSAQCLKIELHGKTQSSDFLSGYFLNQDSEFQQLFPNYGRRDLNHPWVSWRLFKSDDLYFLELSPESLLVLREDLLRLMGEANGQPAFPSSVGKDDRSTINDANNPGAANKSSAIRMDKPVVEQASDGQMESVIAKRHKPITAEVEQSAAPAEATAKPSLRGPVILRLKQVIERTGLSRSTIYDRMNPNSPRHDTSFPKQISLGGDAVGWFEAEIDTWIQSCKDSRMS